MHACACAVQVQWHDFEEDPETPQRAHWAMALCVSALTLNASNVVRKMSTVVQLWYSENGRCTQTGKATAVSGSMCCGGRRHIHLLLRFSLAWCFLTM